MATGGLYGQSSAGIISPQSGSESSGLYGNNTVFGGTYFEWFIFQESSTQPATPTGGSWDFLTNTGTVPSGWTQSPPAAPINEIWVSIALVNSKTTSSFVWSTPGLLGVIASTNVGTTTTGAAGSSASVVNSGTPLDAVLDFTIPRGDTGAVGPAATIAAGTTTTTAPGTNATVTNVGTSGAAVFDFEIPRGAGVNSGGTTGQVLAKASNSDYDTSWINITGGLNYQGTWNASTNTPTLTSSVGTLGFYYVVATSGSTNLDGITDWVVGDWAVFNGSTWQKIDQTNLVTSVAGRTGAVILTTADIGGLGTIATQNANSVAITGGSINGTTLGATSPSTVNATTINATGKTTLPASTSSFTPFNIAVGATPTTASNGDIWVETNGVFSHNQGYTNQLDFDTNMSGVLAMPTITITGSGSTFSASSVDAFLFSLPTFGGDFRKFTIPAITGLSLVDQTTTYLVVKFNGGSPVFDVTLNVADINGSDIAGAAILYRNGTEVHHQSVNWGLAPASRINRRLIQTRRYERGMGLSLGESTGRVITLTSGVIWYGVTEYAETAQTSASSNAEFWFHTAGVWTKSVVSTYNNTQYDNGTNLVTLSGVGTQYAVNWVYRYLDGAGLPKLAYVLGTGNYNLAQAVASGSPTPPAILSQMAILVGRIIVAQNASTATQIDSAFTQVFSGTTVTDHNDLANIQGGTLDEYYHLTSAEYTGTGTGVFVRASGGTASFAGLTATGDPSFTSTGAVQLPTGTTAQQPTGVAGKLRFNSTTSQFEGYNGTSWAAVGGGASISNDTSTVTDVYPLFASATTGAASTVYTSNANYLYKPSTGELKAKTHTSTNGITVNSDSVSSNQTIATGTNGLSVGPITVASGVSVTVNSGQRWLIL